MIATKKIPNKYLIKKTNLKNLENLLLIILYDLYLGKKNQALEHYHLYQALLAQPDRQVSGWIADVTRQLASSEQAQIAETN